MEYWSVGVLGPSFDYSVTGLAAWGIRAHEHGLEARDTLFMGRMPTPQPVLHCSNTPLLRSPS
jgi:hypothetical protein